MTIQLIQNKTKMHLSTCDIKKQPKNSSKSMLNDDISSTRYKRLEKRGEGTYGVVFKAEDLQNKNNIVALKIMKLEQEEDGIPPTTLREMSILRSVTHPNIVKLEDVIIKQGSLTLVFEYLEFDLRFFLNHSRNKISMQLLRSYAFQMLAGLNALHSHRILHRDIKPDNILLNKAGYLKICDFGLARYFTIPMRQYSGNVVSQWYRAPELLFGMEMYGLAIDVWSAGCILGEMCSGLPLFQGDSDVDQLHKIFSVLGTPSVEECPMLARNDPSSNDVNVTTNDVNVTTNGENVTTNGENVTTNGENVTTNGENVTINGENVTINGENVTINDENVTIKGENVTINGENVTINGENVTINETSYVTNTPPAQAQFPMYQKQKMEDVLNTNDVLLIDLVRKMLLFDPQKRITVQEAMRHPFFDTLPPAIRKMSALE